jgi:hypothetical protein
MMEAVNTSEMSVNFCDTTWYKIPEDSHLHDDEPSSFIKSREFLD